MSTDWRIYWMSERMTQSKLKMLTYLKSIWAFIRLYLDFHFFGEKKGPKQKTQQKSIFIFSLSNIILFDPTSFIIKHYSFLKKNKKNNWHALVLYMNFYFQPELMIILWSRKHSSDDLPVQCAVPVHCAWMVNELV